MGYDYDLFVLGAGSGGLAASKRAARYGAKVAIAGDALQEILHFLIAQAIAVMNAQFQQPLAYAPTVPLLGQLEEGAIAPIALESLHLELKLPVPGFQPDASVAVAKCISVFFSS